MYNWLGLWVFLLKMNVNLWYLLLYNQIWWLLKCNTLNFRSFFMLNFFGFTLLKLYGSVRISSHWSDRVILVNNDRILSFNWREAFLPFLIRKWNHLFWHIFWYSAKSSLTVWPGSHEINMICCYHIVLQRQLCQIFLLNFYFFLLLTFH